MCACATDVMGTFHTVLNLISLVPFSSTHRRIYRVILIKTHERTLVLVASTSRKARTQTPSAKRSDL